MICSHPSICWLLSSLITVFHYWIGFLSHIYPLSCPDRIFSYLTTLFPHFLAPIPIPTRFSTLLTICFATITIWTTYPSFYFHLQTISLTQLSFSFYHWSPHPTLSISPHISPDLLSPSPPLLPNNFSTVQSHHSELHLFAGSMQLNVEHGTTHFSDSNFHLQRSYHRVDSLITLTHVSSNYFPSRPASSITICSSFAPYLTTDGIATIYFSRNQQHSREINLLFCFTMWKLFFSLLIGHSPEFGLLSTQESTRLSFLRCLRGRLADEWRNPTIRKISTPFLFVIWTF